MVRRVRCQVTCDDNADLDAAARLPAKQRAVKINKVLERLTTAAYEDGLPVHALETLVDLITLPNELDQASIVAIIRNLYPEGRVSKSIVLKVVGSLGHGRTKPSLTAQAAMLKWIIMVYEVLDDQKILSQLYGFLFNLLDTIALRFVYAVYVLEFHR